MSKYENVRMWIALDENDNQVFIEDAQPGKDYYCGSCGSIVRARAQSSDCVTEHFYHLENSNCNGESEIHKYWKNNLINIGEIFTLPNIGKTTCVDKRIEYVFDTKNGIYKPDLIVKTDNKLYKYIIFEIYYTNNKKLSNYYNMWQEIGLYVFEVNINDLKRDKSNLIDCLKILYGNTDEKILFIKKSKEKIKQLYKLIETSNIYMGYYEIEPILNKFNKIFKNNLKQPTGVNLNILEQKLKNHWWNKDVYKNFIIPLNNIFIELKHYI